jgi:phage shock protein PspC (stress-responsive transcriptional regulator)
MGATMRQRHTEAMNEETPTDDSTEAPPPPPSSDDTTYGEGRNLRRSRSDRVIAGVGGGLGHYFGIDPVIVRIGFVLLTVFGGSGILLYLLAWLIMAKEGREESTAMRALRGSPDGNRFLLLIVLGIGAILILASPLVWLPGFGLGDGLAFPLLLVAAGVALLIWPADRHEGRSDWHDEVADRGPPFDDPIDVSITEARADLAAAGEEIRTELGEARESFRQQRQQWRHGYQRRHPDGPRRPRPRRAPRPPRPKPFLGPLTVAVLLIISGGAVVGTQLDWFVFDPAVYAGICLAVLGLALVLSAFIGRARGLILLGFLILPIAWGLAALDLDWNDGVGERTVVVASVDQLQDEYHYGIGEYIVDLSDVSLGSGVHATSVSLTIGEVTVYVPENMTVDIDMDGRIGEIEIEGVDRDFVDDGVDVDLGVLLEGTEPGLLDLDLDIGLGHGVVTVCTNVGTPGVVPCP